MKKVDAETAVKSLAIDWRSETARHSVEPQNLPFSEFYAWLQEKHPKCLEFRPSANGTGSVQDVVEHWFNEALRVPVYYR